MRENWAAIFAKSRHILRPKVTLEEEEEPKKIFPPSFAHAP